MTESNSVTLAWFREEAARRKMHILWDPRPLPGFPDGKDFYRVPESMDLADLFLLPEEKRLEYWIAWLAEVEI